MAGNFIPKLDQRDEFAPHPLIRFKGNLKNYVTETKESQDPGGKARLSVTFNFTDVVVIESREPYVFPIATITISYSEGRDTRWAAWTNSFKAVVPADSWASSDPIQEALVGRNQEWYFKSASLRAPVRDENNEIVMENGKQKWAKQPADAWQIEGVEGLTQATGPGLMDALVDFAHGKTDKEIFQEALTNQSWKNLAGYNDMVEGVTGRTLLPVLVSSGKLTANPDGTYSKV